MAENENKALQKTVAPLVVPLVISVIVTGIGAFTSFQVATYRIEQAERKIAANEARFDEFAKEVRDADKTILESTNRQLDDIKKALYRIEGKLEMR